MPNRPSIPAQVQRRIIIESGHRCAVCGDPTQLELAHIVPYTKSEHHGPENLICLCPNCHERADKEKWGERTLGEYKRNPWVKRKYTSGETALPNVTKVVITIDMEFERFNLRSSIHLQHGLASLLNIPLEFARVNSVMKKKGVVRVVETLPQAEAQQLVLEHATKGSKLAEHLAPLSVLSIDRAHESHERALFVFKPKHTLLSVMQELEVGFKIGSVEVQTEHERHSYAAHSINQSPFRAAMFIPGLLKTTFKLVFRMESTFSILLRRKLRRKSARKKP